jgi:hypothetical protein
MVTHTVYDIAALVYFFRVHRSGYASFAIAEGRA